MQTIGPGGRLLGKLRNSALELVRDAAKSRMFPVLDLEPVVAASWPVDALAMLGDQALKPHAAGSLEQLGTDLALLEGRQCCRAGRPRSGWRGISWRRLPIGC